MGMATDAEGRFKVLMPVDSGRNIGGFLYRDEDLREGEDSEVEGRRGAEGAFYRVVG